MSACGILFGAEAEDFFAPADLAMTTPSFLKNRQILKNADNYA
jgi:hypothetical protein